MVSYRIIVLTSDVADAIDFQGDLELRTIEVREVIKQSSLLTPEISSLLVLE